MHKLTVRSIEMSRDESLLLETGGWRLEVSNVVARKHANVVFWFCPFLSSSSSLAGNSNH